MIYKDTVNLKQLNNFLVVAELLSISKAAIRLKTSQPSLSRQIKAFEEELGWQLFTRGAKSIELTHEGKVVFEEGKNLQKQVDRYLLRMSQRIGQGILRIGFSPSIAGSLLNKILPLFKKKHPYVRIHLSDLSSSNMREKLLQRELDLIIEEIGETDKIKWTKLYSMGRSYAVPPNHPLYTKKNISPEEINNEQLLVYSKKNYPSFWRDLTCYFKENKINAKVLAELDGLDSMIIYLEAGLGIGIISDKSIIPKHIRRIPAVPPIAPIYTGVGYLNIETQAPYMLDFIQLLKNTADAHS